MSSRFNVPQASRRHPWPPSPSAPLVRTPLRLLELFFVWLYCLGCTDAPSQPVTVTLLDQGWMTSDFVDQRKEMLHQFTRETGIQVKVLPTPETSLDQLAFWEKLLSSGSDSPDVYGVDIIWPATLQDYLLDLKPYLGAEPAAHFPELVEKYTVRGKLLAMPYHANVGVLFYRKDLLNRYGYREPPKTWNQLQQMAARIQSGERSRGKRNFWGFIWQGGPAESLTCNALEWQAAEGGGDIIDADGTITVNNPRAFESWKRAAGWVGSISPPGVVAYAESDTNNIWLQGQAAFMRNWTPAYRWTHSATPIKDKVELTLLPADPQGRTGTLGGSGLGVSRFSSHPREAIALVRFLCRKDIEEEWAQIFSEPPTLPVLYHDPQLLAVDPFLVKLEPAFEGKSLLRPSQVTAKNYMQVSTAYFQAVHSVLTNQKAPSEAAAQLERRLSGIPGLKLRAARIEPVQPRN